MLWAIQTQHREEKGQLCCEQDPLPRQSWAWPPPRLVGFSPWQWPVLPTGHQCWQSSMSPAEAPKEEREGGYL